MSHDNPDHQEPRPQGIPGETWTEAGALVKALEDALVGWGRVWRITGLERRISYTFDPRLKRGLGRCIPRTGAITLNEVLLRPENRGLLFETLCHEAAHAAAYILHGPMARAHGAEWRVLMKFAGFEPRRVIGAHEVDGLQPARTPHPHKPRYEYRCQGCDLVHEASVRRTTWRCKRCVDAGKPGLLTVRRLAAPNPDPR